YDDVAARNPRLVYATISAFGRRGPWRDRPRVDGIVQATGGIMSVTGTEDSGPVKVGVPAADMVAGIFASQAIVAALYARARTGRGQRVDLSLLEALLAFQVVPLSMYLASGSPPRRLGSAAPYSAPNEAYRTADGWIQVAAYTPQRWPRLCRAIGRPDLVEDPRFVDNPARVTNRDALREELERAFEQRTTKEWIAVLEEVDVLCAPILGYPELLAEDHLEAIEALPRYDHPEVGELRAVREPATFSETPARHRSAAPLRPGEHTREVLGEAGYDDEEIRRLIERGVVEAPEVRKEDP
ncbi:MAG TPA: CoA transferase, partial [Actinobacteria bacterium]|nr:CoA transferase [Actinomycetota bacterium]